MAIGNGERESERDQLFDHKQSCSCCQLALSHSVFFLIVAGCWLYISGCLGAVVWNVIQLNSGGQPLLADFGWAKFATHTNTVSSDVRGTWQWMAPEMMQAEQQHSNKVDIYSFGVVLWELLSGEVSVYLPTKPTHCFATHRKSTS